MGDRRFDQGDRCATGKFLKPRSNIIELLKSVSVAFNPSLQQLRTLLRFTNENILINCLHQ